MHRNAITFGFVIVNQREPQRADELNPNRFAGETEEEYYADPVALEPMFGHRTQHQGLL
jgi:hypothetical protein